MPCSDILQGGGAPTLKFDNSESDISVFGAIKQRIMKLLTKDNGAATMSLNVRSFTSTIVAPSESNSSNSSGGGNDVTDGVSFVGNTTSTVLFFLALAVGVLIAVLFVFFTFRYFVRSKYGLHVYPIPRRSLFATPSLPVNHNNLTNVELQEQINYIRDNNYIRGEILVRRINHGRNRRRRRGGRYSRMKKLTEQEIEILFPKKTYNDWLNGGQERDHEFRDGVLQEESMLASTGNRKQRTEDDTFEVNEAQEDNLIRTVSQKSTDNALELNTSPLTKVEGIEMQNMKLDEIPHATHVSSPIEETNDDLHFTSGTCAICLEILENDDDVRGLICGHVFHSECLDPWLTKRRACCPMCKRDYFFKDEHNNSLNQSGEANSTTNNNSNEDENDDDDDIDFEAFRNDPALSTLLQELIPLHERVRSILSDPALFSLNIEQRANEIATKKRSNALKVVWWTIMGISKENLFNWAVITIHCEYKQTLPVSTANNNPTNAEADQNNDDNTTVTTADNDNGHSESTNPILHLNDAATRDNDLSNGNTIVNTETNVSPYESSARQDSASVISRDITEQRV